MTGVIVPELVRVQLRGVDGHPIAAAGIVLGVRLRARRKNDYHLAPFVSDAAGMVEITGERCRALVDAEHEAGLMDHAGLEWCEPTVELQVWDATAIEAAVTARRTWPLLRGEGRLYGSAEELVSVYRAAPNRTWHECCPPVQDTWDGTRPVHELSYDNIPVPAS